ncbi:septation protein A [Methylosinus sp. PW1]|uniref:septation protein A n=1 Tax=Methylosinus sp. PW1 TaxID=107636 RepID=UPI000567AC3D|nr:septation protein A [Methylosinus sp. PW1]
MTQETTAASAKRRLHPGLKFALEMGPLVLFFIVNQKFGIFQATAALMVAVVATLAVSYSITRHLPTMPMVTAVFVLVFGSLTFFLQDENFIKLKVTILYLLFGSALLGALWFGKLLLPAVFESAFRLDDAGWRKLTWRWALFFFFLAALNEFVRRGFPTDVWVNFKVFGILPLTLLYALSQIPLMMRHELKEDVGEEPDSHF